MKGSGGKRGWHQVGETAFTYQNNKRNESIIIIAEQIIVIYIWKISGERLHIFGKSNLITLKPSLMIQTLFYFSPLVIH